jgi:hypothetical protein
MKLRFHRQRVCNKKDGLVLDKGRSAQLRSISGKTRPFF